MKEKLTKHGNSFALIIDKPILKMLKITDKTNLELSIEDGKLVVKPILKGDKKKKNLDEIANRIMDKYEEVFKKLAK